LLSRRRRERGTATVRHLRGRHARRCGERAQSVCKAHVVPRGEAESYDCEPNSDHDGRSAGIVLGTEAVLNDAGGAVNQRDRGQGVDQKRDAVAAGGPVNRPSLTGGTGRIVMRVMAWYSLRLDVRRHAPVSPFGERSNGHDDLSDHRQKRDDAGQPAALSYGEVTK